MTKSADALLSRLGPGRVALAGVLVALLVRGAWLLLHPVPLDGDERHYVALANHLVDLGRFSLEPDGPLEGHLGPAYPGLQALLVACGVPAAPAGWILSLIAGSLTAGLVYPLGLLLWNRPSAAAVATLAAVVHPGMISASRHIYPEALSSLFLLLAVYSLTAKRRPGVRCGAALGFAALTRREAFFLAPLAAVVLFLTPATDAEDRSRRWRLRQVAVLLATCAAMFAPYLVYVRIASGHWTISGRANYAWVVGRQMEQRPGEGLPLEDIQRVEAAYPTPFAYFRAQPLATVTALTRTAGLHLVIAFTDLYSWPIGLLAIAGLTTALATGRLRLWPPPALLLPFVLVLAWAGAGPIHRYDKALGPFVCLLAGAVVFAPTSSVE